MTTHVRTVAATATVALSLLVTALAVHAESYGLRARIPFAFSAGTTELPSGTYTIQRADFAQGILMIRNLNKGVMVLSQRGYGAGAAEKPRFVFRRYGRQYFLREVWFTESGGYALPETRQERDAAAEATKSASLQTTVTIAAVLDATPSPAKTKTARGDD
jgi:hypothetical protein